MFRNTTRKAPLWIIQNKQGHYLASYRSYTSQNAINLFIRDFNDAVPASDLVAVEVDTSKRKQS